MRTVSKSRSSTKPTRFCKGRARAEYADAVSPHSTIVVPHLDWVPLSVPAMRHVFDQVRGTRDIPDAALALAAQGFLAPQPGAVHFAAQRRVVGSTALILMTLSALRVTGRGHDTSSGIHVGFVVDGRITLTLRATGETTVLGPGSVCVVTNWDWFDVESASGTRCLHIIVPENRLRERGVRVRANRFRLDASRSLRTPLRAFALAVADANWKATPIGVRIAEQTIEDLLVGMFLEADGYAMDGEDLRADLRARALAEIADSHRQPDLNPAVVAERLGVSLRHLQRAFEESTTSVSAEITHKRADTAALLLVAPGAAALTVAEIAKHSGFSSTFELRAAFRAHFGMLPSELRSAGKVPLSFAPEGDQIRAYTQSR